MLPWSGWNQNRLYPDLKLKGKKRRFDAAGLSSVECNDVALEAEKMVEAMYSEDGEDAEAPSFQATAEALIAAADDTFDEAQESEDDLLTLADIFARPYTQETPHPRNPTPAASNLRSSPSANMYHRIKLQDVFNYERESGEVAGLQFYWDISRLAAEREARVLELAQEAN